MKEKLKSILIFLNPIKNLKKELTVSASIAISFFLGICGTLTMLHFFPMEFVTINEEQTEITMDEAAINDAIENVYDAVVVVETYTGSTAVASGTGFVYKQDSKYGYIITNNHVISGSNKVYATFSDGERVQTTVLGSDIYGDIAVLRVPVASIIQVADMGDSDKLNIGSTVFAIGAPISSDYSGTTTRGCISGTNRAITVTLDNYSEELMEVIQTDAAINPGNSGGPLIDLAGQVIGVTSSKLVDASVEGIGFAIPINDVKHYVEFLEKGEIISRPVLGVSLYDFDDRYTRFFSGLQDNNALTEGAIIDSVVPNSSAAKAGLQSNDVITKINNVAIANSAELRYQLYKYDIGDKIALTYYRDNASHEVKITLKG